MLLDAKIKKKLYGSSSLFISYCEIEKPCTLFIFNIPQKVLIYKLQIQPRKRSIKPKPLMNTFDETILDIFKLFLQGKRAEDVFHISVNR